MNNRQLIQFLNKLLSNYFVMYVKLHRYHWYVEGDQFFQLHKQFEDMYKTIGEDFEKIAKQILLIDGQPFATMVKYIKEASLTEASADNLSGEMTEQLITDLKQIKLEIVREGIVMARELSDETTIDMLILFQSKLEEYVWMLKAYTHQE